MSLSATWHRLTNVTSQIVFDAEGDKTEEERQTYLDSAQSGDDQQPRGRSSHSISAGRLSNGKEVLVLFGGEDFPRHAFENCLWVWQIGSSSSWTKMTTTGNAPTPRLGHVAGIVGDTFWIFGGRTNAKEDLNDLYSCNLISGEWKKHDASGDIPKDRSYHAADVAGNHLFVWSGCTTESSEFKRLNDLHRLDFSTLKWERLVIEGEIPEGRGGSNVAAMDPEHLIVFGGFAGRQLGDLITYDLKSKKWSPIAVKSVENPHERSVSCGLKLDGNRFFTFGGEKEASATGHEGAGMYWGDSFVLDVNAKEWHKIKEGPEDPTPRGWFSACSLGNMVFLFGGYDGVGRINDLYEIQL
eukprot:TRINITY_DN8596_c0_g1_i2.p1 TRINITY_DN8596_c0_g1~~TRINITY_DN8596_c0_g1_i2.p1  ORF type:complete len:355 (-),score=103.10 TRINITY_DN8596_c0_g1_i2:149-1213(-)